MAYHQRIKCNVVECVHNSLESSTCRLDEIIVTHGKTRNDNDTDDETACGMYKFIGNLNAEAYSRQRDS